MPNKRKFSRGYSERKVDNREVKQTFLIVCEGEKTEPNYFKSFRLVSAIIHIQGVGFNPSKLIEETKKLSNEDDYDQVWCVFDRDDWPKEDFNNAIVKAEKEGFKVAYSNWAFNNLSSALGKSKSLNIFPLLIITLSSLFIVFLISIINSCK